MVSITLVSFTRIWLIGSWVSYTLECSIQSIMYLYVILNTNEGCCISTKTFSYLKTIFDNDNKYKTMNFTLHVPNHSELFNIFK